MCHGTLVTVRGDNLWRMLFSFHIWVPGTGLKTLGLTAGAFIH